MKKPELLAPAGNMDCLKAAILAGCDAVYLGGNMFGARSFANNFDYDELKEAVNYAHEYGVKVYVTTNTLIYENEVERFTEYVSYLNSIHVDAIIMQDIGMMDKMRKEFPDMEIHASTQMHIHNEEGVKLVKELGLTRAVLARETDYQTIKKIKENVDIELEIFVHGALCISYSGQCLMSSLIGNRSGNRGTCAGSCRHKYDVLNENFEKINNHKYNLSTKDLNSLNDLEKLIKTGADSFKIEGRMKSKSYVYLVVKLYRMAIDSYFEKGKIEINNSDLEDLKVTFNRLFTKGFLFNADNNDIINPYRPNHLGVEIGKVIECKNNYITIKLEKNLAINDGIRIISKQDIGFIVTSLFKNKKRISEAKKGDIVSIPLKDKIDKNSTVVKTVDYKTNQKIENILTTSKRTVKINGFMELKKNQYVTLQINDGINNIKVKSNIVAESPLKIPTDVNRIYEQVCKTGGTIYEFENLEIDAEDEIFIPIKEINELRRKALEELKRKRLERKEIKREKYYFDMLKDYPASKEKNIYIKSINQYNQIKNRNYNNIIMDKELYEKIHDERKILKLPRVINNYEEYSNKLLIGEMGSLNKYKNIDTDFSFNVVNSYSVAFLHEHGANKITLSYEMEEYQIKELIDAYKERYKKHPNLEVIVYGKEEVMISKFNLLKYYNLENKGFLKDRFNNQYPIFINNDLMYIYNYKPRKIKNIEGLYSMGVNAIRYNYVDEISISL
jgi:putative protease